MRYSKTHKFETRRKLMAGARAIAKRSGFGVTGVDAMMASVGLTGAAFYGHFQSKDALFAELIEEEVVNSTKMLLGDEANPPERLGKVLRSYLSSWHAMNPEVGCALPTLGAEIARADPKTKATVERCLKNIHDRLARRIDGPDAAWALISQCVGALVLARAVGTERLRKDILKANRRFVESAHQIECETARW